MRPAGPAAPLTRATSLGPAWPLLVGATSGNPGDMIQFRDLSNQPTGGPDQRCPAPLSRDRLVTRDPCRQMVAIDPTAPLPEEHESGAITKVRYMTYRDRQSSSSQLGFRIEGLKVGNMFSLWVIRTSSSFQASGPSVRLWYTVQNW